MAFRIGKSVLLNFGNNLEPIFIFIGLSFLLLIGPLLRWYLIAMTKPNFKFTKAIAMELLPFALILIVSFFIANKDFDTTNKQTIVLFGSVLIFIYLHFATYILIAGIKLRNIKKQYINVLQTKFQKAILKWLQLLVLSFIVIWISYAFNILENTIPYIVGPIMYSVAVYFLSYKAFELKITDIDGSAFKPNEDEQLFSELLKIVKEDKLFLDPDVSLLMLGKRIGKTTQKTSEVINQYAKQNFNDFINYYRIQETKRVLSDSEYLNYTISSIAFDVGFSSLSSFNSAFKKFEGTTPSTYRKNNVE
ncbi:helix-turn-helix domain-containing protein [Pontimicrobium sp. IMCC45349]|uniref:AraC family transcriptional regulator n=1 Tax=Pontimicrobium sp. IMCC45349 TaxID=3391574 RepID=UPI0039A058E1